MLTPPNHAGTRRREKPFPDSTAALSAEVCLVNMPYVSLEHPSIGLGLLKAALDNTEIRAEIVYANIFFAEEVGLHSYREIETSAAEYLLGDWVFSGSAFPDFHPDHDRYLDLILRKGWGWGRVQDSEMAAYKEFLWLMRKRAGTFVDRMAESILERGPRIVGCSSTFMQNCASLALLKRIRDLSPATVTMMGGANCEAEMGAETRRACPWVDFVVSGEADMLFYDLCRRVLDQGREVDPEDLPYGVICARDVETDPGPSRRSGPFPPRAIVRDLDTLPAPDYGDYFQALAATPAIASAIKPGLLAEGSRGCWWGEKSHCSFCGLNGIGMGYRFKSAERLTAEVAELAERYDMRNFEFVDNILEMSHIDSVLPVLAASSEPYSIFYEVKSNLKRDHLRKLAAAGVRVLQPGIESMHDSILSLIAKGNSTMVNIQMLKWSREFGIANQWNLLCGFPGESDDWYYEMAEWLPLLFHLEAPRGLMRLKYDRFSPYHTAQDDYGIQLAPFRTYAAVYPLEDDALMRLAYYFEDVKEGDPINRWKFLQPGQAEVDRVIRSWLQAWRGSAPPMLSLIDEGESLRILDTRPCAVEPAVVLEGLTAEIYRACAEPKTEASLLRKLNKGRENALPSEEVAELVAELRRRKLLLEYRGKLLSLAIEGPLPSFLRDEDFPGGYAPASDFDQVKQESERYGLLWAAAGRKAS